MLKPFRRSAFAACAVLPTVAACATLTPQELPAGTFTGEVIVMWVGEGGSSGDGRFLYVPNPARPLTFTRSDPKAPGAVIKPSMMYTDGGSIPRIAQVFKGFSPWGYAPAYMIHDWLFAARHCLTDGDPDPRYQRVADVGFDDSARILGEAISALVASRQVARNDVAETVITSAVDSSVARGLWEAKGACAEGKVSPQHRAAAEAAIPGSSEAIVRAGQPRALVVGRVTFR